MTPEEFDTILMQAMDKFYSEVREVAEHVDETDRLQRESIGIRGWCKILFKKDGLEEVKEQRAEYEKLNVHKTLYLEKAKGTIQGVADFLSDVLPSSMSGTIIDAVNEAGKNFASEHRRRYGTSIPNPQSFVREFGRTIETAMYTAAQKYIIGQNR